MRALSFFACGILVVAPPCIGQSPLLSIRYDAANPTNRIELTLGSIPEAGALFVHGAPDLGALSVSPSLVWETNSPIPSALQVPIASSSSLSTQAFFTAVFWPGRSVDEFGDPEYHPDESPPSMILLTSGAPTNLASGQTFTVDFFITNPTGELLDITALVSILVLRESDGAPHPDAWVLPATGQVTNGHLRLEITVQAATSLDGYTLGLGPAPLIGLAFSDAFMAGFETLDRFLKTVFNLGNSPLTIPTRQELLQILETVRINSSDFGPSWGYPLQGSGHPVSGTFGEWRGDNNTRSHHGLDLAAVASTIVWPSRGGVVSFKGTLNNPPQGDYLVIDHGGGWFSRYLHLDGSSIAVREGQVVDRATPLAARLYAVGSWPKHLHFEVQHGPDHGQWGHPKPGSAQDPLQTQDIFAVPTGTAQPELLECGLTRSHLGQHAFDKCPPTADANGAIYLFAQFVDIEPKAGGGDHRLSLRVLRFLPEGATQAIEIWPNNDAAISLLKPPPVGTPATDMQKGFARYSDPEAANPDRLTFYRYWWRWDTSAYGSADERKGPRHFVLSGEDYSGAPVSHDFWFGPEVTNSLITAVTGQQYQFTVRAHLGTNTPAALNNPALFVQPDQYKLELLQANGQPLGGVGWSGPMAGGYTRVFNTHLDEAVYTFTLPGGATTEGLKLRVSSRLAPDIAHEVCFCYGPNMVWIPPGTFTMGSPPTEPARYGNETQHSVTISKGFCIGRYEVTQAEYVAVIGTNPSYYNGIRRDVYDQSCGCFVDRDYGTDLNRPVEQVSWHDATNYCALVTQLARAAGRLPEGYVYRLPTEAEWEYACRAGTATPFSFGSELRSGNAYVNFNGPWEYPPCGGSPDYCFNPSGIYLDRTTPVGSYLPNGWGLYDMHGNVWEWCLDWYGAYPGGSVTDPTGLASGSSRVYRGAGFGGVASACRSAARSGHYPALTTLEGGFRVALVAVP